MHHRPNTHHDDEGDEQEAQPLLSQASGGTPHAAGSQEGTRPRASCLQSMIAAGKKLRQEVLAMYLALLDPECSWAARGMVLLVLCYALSPLDWIPELIPLLALMVDFLVLPLMIWICVKLMPAEVLDRARQKAAQHQLTLTGDWHLMVLVYLLWVLNVVVGIRILAKHSAEGSYLHHHQLKLMLAGALTVTLFFAVLAWWRLSVENKSEAVEPGPHDDPEQPLITRRPSVDATGTGAQGNGGR